MSESKGKSARRVVLYTVFGLGFMALIVAVVMWLWNALMPRIASWETINYWEAFGLVIMLRLMNGTLFPKGESKKDRDAKRKQHLHQMTPEERKAFLGRLMSDSDTDTAKDEQQ